MLLQYIRTAEASIESAIAWNLVHLALVAPQKAFVDILRAFCFMNRSSKVGEDRTLNNMVRSLSNYSLTLNSYQGIGSSNPSRTEHALEALLL